MSPEAAKTRIALMTAATSDPVLAVGELDALLDVARRADAHGRAPDDASWEPTWALGAAASEGWRWKAGKASERVDVRGDDTSLSRSQVMRHCLAMADRYERRPMSAVVLGRHQSARLPAELAEGWGALLPGAQGPVHVGPPYLSAHALPGAAERGDSTA